ncbi:hypothetical protein CBS9595_003223 [Malassezia furfur]|nr:hypothetical protein CBS9595_003223 [Malassezia furfur]
MAGSDPAVSDMEVSDASDPGTPEEFMEATVSDLRASAIQEPTMRYLTELGDVFLPSPTPNHALHPN